MELLNEAEAKSLRKMSTAQLRGKLLSNLSLIEVTADQVAEMPREALLGRMANLFTLLKEQVEDPLSTMEIEDEREAEVVDPLVPPGVPGVDAAIQLETLKLHLQLQRERQMHEREMQDKDLEMRRMEAASAERLKRDELEIKRLKITEQNKREQQQVILLKRYTEALKGVLHPQPADPCALPLYFDNLERLYKQFEVPAKLQASLLIPYLNTRTQMMITRLPAGDLENYTKLKEFILAQHKLSSKDYRQRFSQAMRNSNETNVAYVSRLSTLQDYWLRSKEVTTFDQLCDLHVLENCMTRYIQLYLGMYLQLRQIKTLLLCQQLRLLMYLRETCPQTQSSGIKLNILNLILSIKIEVENLMVEDVKKMNPKRAMRKMVHNQKQIKMTFIRKMITRQKRKRGT